MSVPARSLQPPVFLAGAPAIVRAAEAIGRAAATDVRVVLYGEPGVGKRHGVVWLHAASPRRDGPLVRLSAGDPAAPARLGDPSFLAAVAGGTLAVEGVDGAPSDVQALLVGAIGEWGVAEDDHEAAVRFVGTAEGDLLAGVEAGTFRKDLYFLLDVFPVVLPPLRERPDEIPMFMEHFYRRLGGAGEAPPLPEEFLAEALGHRWPGNLRELENLVAAALPRSPAEGWRLPGLLPRRGGAPPVLAFPEAKREFEVAYVRRLLLLTGGNVTRAAQVAGKARKDFYALMTRNGIDPSEFRTRLVG
ncbi:MAG: sigma-54-dependent transcriptional regulator [Deferrisomatales bacterium]